MVGNPFRIIAVITKHNDRFGELKLTMETVEKAVLTIRKTVQKLNFIYGFRSRNEKIMAFGILIYTVALSLLTSLKHYSFRTFAFDFGIFLQVFWHTLNGNFMFSQPYGTSLHPSSFLGAHVSPLVLLLLPVYALIKSPYTLLTIQSLVLGLPAFYIYKIAQMITGKENLSLLFAVAYLLYPATLWSNWYDFHLEAFIPLFLSMMYYYYFAEKKKGFIISAVLLLMVFETAALIIVFFIIYILLRELYILKRNKQTSSLMKGGIVKNIGILAGLAVFSLAYFLICEFLMNGIWPERLILEPPRIFGNISYDALLLKISYIIIFTAPFAFLSFESPLELIPACPYLFLAMCTDYKPYYTINWQYPAIISVPFVISAVFGVLHLNKIKRIYAKLMASSLLFFVLVAPFSPLMVQFSDDWRVAIPDNEMYLKHQALSFLEADASVLAQENIFPHVAERETAYVIWPENLDPPDYIVFDVLNWRFYLTPSEKPTRDAVFDLISKYNYGIFAVANGLIVLKKDYEGPSRVLSPLHTSIELNNILKSFIAFEDAFKETRFFVSDWVEVKGDYLFLRQGFSGNAWWGPYITVPPGKFRIQVRFSVDEQFQGPIMRVLAYRWNQSSIGTKVYAEKIIVGDDLQPGKVITVTLEFELNHWESSLEIVGESYGNANIKVYEVKFEGIE
jgi:uncharacterized membrane protein